MDRSLFMLFMARVTAIGGLVLVIGHFVATILYLNPISVIGLDYHAPVAGYLDPLFRQRWSLFAPDPPLQDRRLDYQCELDGVASPWATRTDALMRAHARWRVGPAASLHRLESAAVVASVGMHDPVFEQLVASADQATTEQQRHLEQLMVERVASTIVTSETAYRLISAYCIEDLGQVPDRMRYRIVTSDVIPYSARNSANVDTHPRAMTLPWLGPDEYGSLEARAIEYLEAYEQQRLRDEAGHE